MVDAMWDQDQFRRPHVESLVGRCRLHSVAQECVSCLGKDKAVDDFMPTLHMGLK